MTWCDCEGREIAIGDPVTFIGPISHHTHLGRHKHGAIVGFGQRYVRVVIDSKAERMAGDEVTVDPGNLLYGHHGYQNLSDRNRVSEDAIATVRIADLLDLGLERGIIVANQAAGLMELWAAEVRFPDAPDG